ncbi:hypothetical protein ACFQ9X_47125 [Catenulispora yoronensis]
MEPLREDDPRSLGGFRVLALLAVGAWGGCTWRWARTGARWR